MVAMKAWLDCVMYERDKMEMVVRYETKEGWASFEWGRNAEKHGT